MAFEKLRTITKSDVCQKEPEPILEHQDGIVE